MFKRFFKFSNFLLFVFICLLTSCFYSGKYTAAYTVRSKQTDKSAKEISIDFINQLADKNSLSRDSRFNKIDTIGFYGRPYHYFKFWFEKGDSNTLIRLDYSGVFGSRKNPPYKDFLNELNGFFKANFIIIDQEIKVENKTKKNN